MIAKARGVLVYGMNYAPEMAGVGRYTGDIAEHLASAGFDVTVVTTPPHYPGWRVRDGHENAYSKADENGVMVLRSPLILKEPMAGLWRLIAPASFAITSAPLVLWQVLKRRPDTICCVEPTLLAAPVALLAARLVGARTVLHVQDLEVDAAFAVGHLRKTRGLTWLARTFEYATLRRFDKVITISNRMAEKLAGKGVRPDRISVVRNWVDLDLIFPMTDPGRYRDEFGYGPEDFVVLYSGNLGVKQGLSVVIDAAEALATESRIKFVIAGEGPAKKELERRAASLPNVRIVPFQPYARLNEFLNMADLHCLPQERGAADLVLPSKLGGMLASGKPIVVTADEGTEIVDFLENSAIVTPAGNAVLLAEAIRLAMHGVVEGAETRVALAKKLSRTAGCDNILREIIASEVAPDPVLSVREVMRPEGRTSPYATISDAHAP